MFVNEEAISKTETEREKVGAMIRYMQEKGSSRDEWHVSLLSSIAASLAIMADDLHRIREVVDKVDEEQQRNH